MFMLAAIEAENRIRARVCPLSQRDPAGVVDWVPLPQALSRILAQGVKSDWDFPLWDQSAMDGYAVRYDEVVAAQKPVRLRLGETIAAGTCPSRSLLPGEAARIFTGAMVPEGADTIVPQEDVICLEDGIASAIDGEIAKGIERAIEITQLPQRLGAFVRYQGDYYQAGSPLLSPGIRLGAADLAVLATARCEFVPVYRSLRVGVLSTGDELVPLAAARSLPRGKQVDINQVALCAALQTLGVTVIPLGIVPDDPELLRQTIATTLPQVDVLISSGGVSVGDYDYVDRILQELGAEFLVRSVAVKPGKPLTVAQFPHLPESPFYFGLPGNPVSALVSFWRFVQPTLAWMSGLNLPLADPWRQGYCTAPLVGDAQRETYIWGQMTWGHVDRPTDRPSDYSADVSRDRPGYWFTPAPGSKSSANIMQFSAVNALAKLPAGQRSLEAGAAVDLWPIP